MSAVPNADQIAAAVSHASVPVSVLVERLERELRRGSFYIVTPDKTSDVEHVAARMRLKREAVELGLAPLRELRADRDSLRAATVAAKEAIGGRGLSKL